MVMSWECERESGLPARSMPPSILSLELNGCSPEDEASVCTIRFWCGPGDTMVPGCPVFVGCRCHMLWYSYSLPGRLLGLGQLFCSIVSSFFFFVCFVSFTMLLFSGACIIDDMYSIAHWWHIHLFLYLFPSASWNDHMGLIKVDVMIPFNSVCTTDDVCGSL